MKDLKRLLDPSRVSESQADRIAYSRDMWPKALLWAREGKYPFQPEAVAWPETEEEVARVLHWASEQGIPVVPYGGGSGVCGAAIPLQGGLVLDLKRLQKILQWDSTSGLVWAQAGILGEILERKLNEKGYTLGHFPSSIYCSTLGGWLATRAAGQMSSRYGKIEDMVLSARIALPTGCVLETPSMGKRSTGPDLLHLFLGSEGTLGIFTAAELVIHPLPSSRLFLGGTFPHLSQALSACREVMQKGIRPAVFRIYDPLDTLLVLSKKENTSSSFFKHWLKKTGLAFLLAHPALLNQTIPFLTKRVLAIVVLEGEREIVEAEKKVLERLFQHHGFRPLENVAKHWWEHRYSVSYKQSPVFCAGAFVDTMEVSAPWGKLEELYQTIRAALLPYGLVFAHFSHAYPFGNSIYFTFGAWRKETQELEKLYDRMWEAGQKACLRVKGAISHHHGIGLGRQKFLPQFFSKDWLNLLKALKQTVDPKGVLNPGKWDF